MVLHGRIGSALVLVGVLLVGGSGANAQDEPSRQTEETQGRRQMIERRLRELAERLQAANERGDHAEAARLYAEALGHGAPHEIALVHLCLAKLYEHQLADPMQAQAHAAFTAPAEGFEKHDKRRARLVVRCAKKGLSIS